MASSTRPLPSSSASAPSASSAPAVVASTAPATGDAQPATLDALARAIAASRDLVDATTRVRPLAVSMGATFAAVDTTGFIVSFPSPPDARQVARAFAIALPLGVSGDPHQHSWRMLERGADVPDAYRKRVATVMPTSGAWALDIALDERPEGPLPNVVAGASPAYDLRHAPARIASITAGPH